MKRFLALVLALCMVLALAACGQNSNDGTSKDGNNSSNSENNSSGNSSTEKIADTIYIGYGTEHTSLNPTKTNNGDTNQLYYQIYSTLWTVAEDGTIVNDLLEDWTVTDDALEYTLYLKKDLKFSDGSDLTMKDVYATLNTYITDPSSPAGAELWFISSMEVVDDLTLKIYLDEPYPPMRNILACNVGVIQSAKVFEYPEEEVNINPETYIFNGPYKLVEWTPNKQIVLERNEYYHGDPAVTDRIVLYPIQEASSRGAALETGDIDVALSIQAEQVQILETMPDMLNVFLAPGPFSRVFRFGCNDKYMSDKRVRLAIMYTVDAKAIDDALFPGLYKECTSATLEGVFGYVNLGAHKPDLEKARALLAEAGYPDGFKTKIVTTTRYAKGVELAEAIAEQLKQVNIEAEVEVKEWAAIQEEWTGQTAETFDEPIFIMGAGCDTLDADTAFNRLYTTSPDGTNTGTNYGFYSNAEVDELVAAAAVSVDEEFRLECYHRVCEILWLEDPAQIYIYDPVTAHGMNNSVHGFWTDPVGSIHMENMYKTID